VIHVYLAFAFFLLLTLLAGLIRIVRGPTRADRMLAAQLFGSTGVALLLILTWVLQLPFLVDVALVLVLVAQTSVLTFLRFVWTSSQESEGENAIEP
jgi:multicomponent Na+:H+ antiporter subunit F